MPSKRRLAPVVGREGINSGFSREQEIPTVELDTTFGRLLSLTEGQKVRATPTLSSIIHVGYLLLAGRIARTPRSTDRAYNQY